jgi:hypothetical protein
MANLTALPSAFFAGTTVKLTRMGGLYPANAGWTRKLYLAGVSVLNLAGVAAGADFTFTISAVASGDLKPGTYQWREIGSKAGESYVVDSGTVTVLANIAAAGAGDMQSWEEATLVVVEAVLAGRITADVQAYTIAGRAVTKIPMAELLELRSTLKRTVQAQKNPGKMGPQVRVAFTGTGNEV